MSAVGGPVRDKGSDREHSGRLLLRMPRALHAQLARLAEERGESLNQLIVGVLAGSLAQRIASPAGPEPSAPAPPTSPRALRRLDIALAVNLVVLLVAAAVAITLLVVALRRGF